MPRVKSWISRIPLILQRLETDGKAFYTRKDVQELFDIRMVRAVDLMRTAGAIVRNGTEAVVSRENLRYYVEHCPEAAVYLAELARKEKVAQGLRQREHAVRFGEMVDGRLKPRDKYLKFEKLTDLAIEPGKLTIVFSGLKDLAYKLAQLALAEANDPATFWAMCEGKAPAKTPQGPAKYPPASHPYVEHPTYTGPGCALCGKRLVHHIDMSGVLRPATPEEIARLGME